MLKFVPERISLPKPDLLIDAAQETFAAGHLGVPDLPHDLRRGRFLVSRSTGGTARSNRDEIGTSHDALPESNALIHRIDGTR